MWIRSQDDELLINLDRVAVLKHDKWFGETDDHGPTHAVVALTDAGNNESFELGRYYTEKRIREIFEEIEDEIEKDSYSVYYMPFE